MDEYYALAKVVAAFAILIQSAMLFLQIVALFRHRRSFFLLLCLSSVFGLIYGVLCALPYLIPLSAPSTLFLLKVGTFFGVAGGLLAIIGTALLFRDYRNLAQAAAKSLSGGA